MGSIHFPDTGNGTFDERESGWKSTASFVRQSGNQNPGRIAGRREEYISADHSGRKAAWIFWYVRKEVVWKRRKSAHTAGGWLL
jgi:carbohydrate ABC transporter substrate-binding protein, CUT1 family (TC 3.A.1.1.-)